MDKITLSEGRNSHSSSSNDGLKLLTDDSILDDLQILSKNNITSTFSNKSNVPALNSHRPKSTLSNNRPNMVEKRASNQTPQQFIQGQQGFLPSPPASSNVTSVTAISDDDSSASSSSNNPSITKLMNELNAMKEKERSHLDQIQSLEEENNKFK